jgi:hypothetical protein
LKTLQGNLPIIDQYRDTKKDVDYNALDTIYFLYYYSVRLQIALPHSFLFY